jgi:hypothetical protein
LTKTDISHLEGGGGILRYVDTWLSRYEKCLEAGMQASLILSEDGKKQRFKRFYERKAQATKRPGGLHVKGNVAEPCHFA